LPYFEKKIFWISIVILGVVGFVVLLFISSFLNSRTSLPHEDIYYDEEYYLKEAPASAIPFFEDGDLEMTAPGQPALERKTASPSEEGEQSEKTSPKIIKSGSLDLVVASVNQTVTQITSLVTKKQGFISDSRIYTREDKTQYGTLELRVPAQHFETTVKALKTLAKTIKKESLSGIDVTEEYVDLVSRLTNLKAEEEQYRKILNNAVTTEGVLKVTNALFNVREDIERIEGKIKYLENLTDLATIIVELSEEPIIEIPTAEWKPLTTIKRAFRSATHFVQGLINLLIWILVYLPPLALITWVLIKVKNRFL